MVGVYIHLPFCKQICSYCDFPKILHNEQIAKQYLKELKREIKSRYQKEIVKTIYFGGGTPSTLNDELLLELIKLIKLFKVDKNIEITFECNIGDLTENKIKRLKEYGINRISYGVQTFNNDFLKLFNRNHTYEQLINEINLLRKNNIDNINFDLIYAIPNQTINDLKLDLDLMIKLKPTHISAYALSIEPHTYLYHKKVKPIDDEFDYAMYEYLRIYLKGRGYSQYEISNYAKPNYHSKHNLIYWRNEPYYGFGLGAASYIDNIRIENTRSLNNYLDGVYVSNEEYMTIEKRMSYEMILGLRLRSGVNRLAFYDKYQKNIEDVFDTTDLLLKDNHYIIPDDKVYVINTILEKFIL